MQYIGKNGTVWKLNSTLLSNPRFKEKSYGKLENISNWIKVKMQHNQNLWDAANIMLRGKLVVVNACVRKEEGLKLMIKLPILGS